MSQKGVKFCKWFVSEKELLYNGVAHCNEAALGQRAQVGKEKTWVLLKEKMGGSISPAGEPQETWTSQVFCVEDNCLSSKLKMSTMSLVVSILLTNASLWKGPLVTVDSLECPCLHIKGIPCFIFRELQIGDLQIKSCFCSHRWSQNCGCEHISEKCVFLRFREDFFSSTFSPLLAFLSFLSPSSLNYLFGLCVLVLFIFAVLFGGHH